MAGPAVSGNKLRKKERKLNAPRHWPHLRWLPERNGRPARSRCGFWPRSSGQRLPLSWASGNCDRPGRTRSPADYAARRRDSRTRAPHASSRSSRRSASCTSSALRWNGSCKNWPNVWILLIYFWRKWNRPTNFCFAPQIVSHVTLAKLLNWRRDLRNREVHPPAEECNQRPTGLGMKRERVFTKAACGWWPTTRQRIFIFSFFFQFLFNLRKVHCSFELLAANYANLW